MGEKELFKEQLKATVDIIDVDRMFKYTTSSERKTLIAETIETFSVANKRFYEKENDELIAEHKRIIRELGR